MCRIFELNFCVFIRFNALDKWIVRVAVAKSWATEESHRHFWEEISNVLLVVEFNTLIKIWLDHQKINIFFGFQYLLILIFSNLSPTVEINLKTQLIITFYGYFIKELQRYLFKIFNKWFIKWLKF